jgi:hypothetical protein
MTDHQPYSRWRWFLTALWRSKREPEAKQATDALQVFRAGVVARSGQEHQRLWAGRCLALMFRRPPTEAEIDAVFSCDIPF